MNIKNINFQKSKKMVLNIFLLCSSEPLKVLYRIGWNYKSDVQNPAEPIAMEDVKKRLVESLTRNQGYIDKYHIDMQEIKVGREFLYIPIIVTKGRKKESASRLVVLQSFLLHLRPVSIIKLKLSSYTLKIGF